MNITADEKNFIKRNKVFLAGLFNKRIEELKEYVLCCSAEEREPMIKMINELKLWLSTINIFSRPKKDKKETFI